MELAKAYVTIVPSMQGSRQIIEEELTGAGDEAGARAGSAAGSAFSSALGAAAKIGTAAIGAAATGISVITTQAVQAYADYEQLTGGIETLYGDASEQMMQFAAQAAQSTGQSMNEFMEAAISTSAAMISAVEGDQARAAELTNQAMIDMADNANKLGTDMEAIQNAYRGFSRGNFTMLDNLALGYAGTKEGMEQLLADAQAISGIEYDIDSYADIVEAIHTVQESLGIAGTTSREASETIQGSIGALAASWQNLLVGVADPTADLGLLIDNLVTNAETAISNLLPVITNALGGIAQAVARLAPIIAGELPTLVTTLLPPLLSAAASVVQGLGQGLITALPTLIPVAIDLVMSLIDFILDPSNIGAIIDAAFQIVFSLSDGLAANLDTLIPAVVAAILTITEKLTDPSSISQLIAAALQICVAIGEGLVAAIPEIVSRIPTIITNIVNTFAQLGPMLLQGAAEWAADLIDGLVNGITNGISRVQGAVSSVAQGIRDFIGFSEPKEGPLSDFHTYMPDMFDMLEEGIEEGAPELEATLNSALAMPAIGQPAALAEGYGSFGGGTETVTPVNIYIGQDKLDTILLRTNQNATYRRGG